MSFSNLLPRSPWTPPHQPASRNNQPASLYSKRQAAHTSQPVAQPVAAEQVAPLPERGRARWLWCRGATARRSIHCCRCRVMSSIRHSARR